MTTDTELPAVRVGRFYEQIGRVVSHAALLEQWVLYLAGVLDDGVEQKEHAGKAGTELICICRSRLSDLPDELAADVTAVLDEVAGVLARRHEVVHSVAVLPGDPVAYAHQPLRPKNRPNDVDWIGNRYLTTEFLYELDRDIELAFVRLHNVMPTTQRPSYAGNAPDTQACGKDRD